ncbi:integrase [Salinigranum rubrum]|uniref:Integrase n=1 Tax=Salinigranum rubrum TaxID=755307 RepID=A0A2I8VLU6_9EURY|nr:tyrosine-type recombinase/integrase [Salinigranum rubrum]AUV82888.1 integrase [Salinigranum rubrum]
MNVDDTNNTARKLERQWELLEEADINDTDRKTIARFVRVQRKGNEALEKNTLIADLSRLRCASTWSESPLVEMNYADVQDLMDFLLTSKRQGGRGLSPDGTAFNGYKDIFRVFFRWLTEQPNQSDFPFWEEIETKSQSINRIDEEQLLSEEDINLLKEGTRNPRDATIIEFLADSGARITLATQLRVKDIHDLDTKRPYFTPNPNGEGHKGAPDKQYPILRSRADIRAWINQYHPDPRPIAPLWPVLRGYDVGNPQDCAVSSDSLRGALSRAAGRVDIEKPVNPHNFRHMAITRLSQEGYSPQEIRHIAGWADDRMLEKYDNTNDRRRNEQIGLKAGFLDETEAETGPSVPQSCGNCRETLAPEARFCPRCGTSTTEKAIEALQEQDNRIFESAVGADDELATAVLQLRELFEEYPVLREVTLSV